jgi:hypothetical protein
VVKVLKPDIYKLANEDDEELTNIDGNGRITHG